MTATKSFLIALAAAFLAAAAILTANGLQAQGGGGPSLPHELDLGSAILPSAPGDAQTGDLAKAAAANPRSSSAYAALAATYQQRFRETADPGYFTRAQSALRRGLAAQPGDPVLLTQQGLLRLSLHNFDGALIDARRAQAAAPLSLRPQAVLVDALVELGRYGAAGAALQTMVDRKPSLDSYTRVGYWRELHGDPAGGIDALRRAVSAGGAAPENTAYALAQIGVLELQRGHIGAAAAAYRTALQRQPGFGAAVAGLARVDVATGHDGRAIRRLTGLVNRLPLPGYALELGELQQATGRRTGARRSFDLVRADQAIFRSAGVDTDIDSAVFEAEHGDTSTAVAAARRGYERAPSVRSADVLGWTLTKAGDPQAGLRYARRAVSLGWRDPMVNYHAGMTAKAAGHPAEARRLLHRALDGHPRFSALHAPRAQRALRELS